MRKVVKQYTNVKFLEVDLDRTYFTRHGMHLNPKGKEFLSHQLAVQVDLIFIKSQSPPIPIPWEMTNPELANAEAHVINTDCNTLEVTHSIQHRRKFPISRHPDFLWT